MEKGTPLTCAAPLLEKQTIQLNARRTMRTENPMPRRPCSVSNSHSLSHAPPTSPPNLPHTLVFRSCTFMVALRHSKLHEMKNGHKTQIDRRTLRKLMDSAAELKQLKACKLMPPTAPSPSPTSLPLGPCTLCARCRGGSDRYVRRRLPRTVVTS